MHPALYIAEIVKNSLLQGALIFLLALGFSIIYRTNRVFHIALGVSSVFGGYLTYFALQVRGFPLLGGYAAGSLAGAISGFVFYQIVFRRLDEAEASPSLRLVGSLGLSICGAGAMAYVFGNHLRYVTNRDDPVIGLARMTFTYSEMMYAASALVVWACGYCYLKRSRAGARLQACASNPLLFQAMGHRAQLYRLLGMVLGSALAGWAGGLEAARNGVDPYSGVTTAVVAAVAAIVGGRSLLGGAVAGALVFGAARTLTTQLFSDRWLDTMTYVVLLLVILANARRVWNPSSPDQRS